MNAPDLIVLAGTIHTLSPTDPLASPRAVTISSGIITHLGSQEEALRLADETTVVVDLGTATITPGLTDSHIHPVMGIDLTRGVDLSTCRDRAAAQEVLADLDSTLPPGEWLLGWGLDPNLFDGSEPDVALFAGCSADRRAYVTLFDAHSAVASLTALEAAGMDGSEAFPDAARVVCTPAGDLTGLLLEISAMQPVIDVIPPLSFEERKSHLLSVLRSMASTGFTGGHVLDANAEDTYDLLRAIEHDGSLPLELRISPWLLPGSKDAAITALIDAQGSGGRRWKIEGVKLMIDGTIDNGTAWLFDPDTHGESTDSLWLSPDEYGVAVRRLHEAGIATATHAIGDKGIDYVAEVLSSLPKSSVRHRIEHIETLTDTTLDLLVASDIAASMQPTHCTHFTRADGTDNWSTRLGPERASRGFRTSDLRRRGITVALGSDWPIAPSDARAILAEAQLRRPVLSPDVEPVGRDQALAAREALEGFTTHSEASIGRVGGHLAVGQPATLSAFDADPLTARPEDFAAAAVHLTMIRGDVVIDNRTSSLRCDDQHRGAP